jgi:dihydroxyacetone kinase-like protein
MKKFINDPYAVVDEMLDGFIRAHGRLIRPAADPRGIVRRDAPVQGKVAVLIGGGSGHEPMFTFYVGRGMADGSVAGNVFASPPPDPILQVTRTIHSGQGVLYLYGNYAGDVMNFDMAAEMAETESIAVKTVRISDDVTSAPKGQEQDRRGVAGDLLAIKVAGAAAEEMRDLESVARAASHCVANLRSIGCALSSCIIPASGKPIFQIGDDEMEIGMGLHGEPGITRAKLKSADEIAAEIVQRIIDDLPFQRGDEVAVLVNGLGATTDMELYILFRRASQILADHGISIYRSYVGQYAISQEMAGASISLLRLDADLKRWIDAPAETPAFVQF